ncbi:MAG TPA: hypothetical protein VL294_02385 [Pseudolysinimonas sp.]|nr:hypothetical protein [Pseudolysinimonas sp.]
MIGPLTILGVVTIVAVGGVFVLRRRWTQVVLGATVAFPQTAGIVVGDNGFPLFYLAVVEVLLLGAPTILMGLARLGTPAARPARGRLAADLAGVALVVWAAVITIAGPRIFAGMRVFDPALGVDSQVGNMSTLEPSLGNLAQLGYLTLGVLVVLAAGRLFPVDARMLGSALWVALVLAAVRLVAEPVWPHELLQNMPGYSYATPERLSGTFYEPSVLGLYLVAAACFFGVRLLRGPAPRARVSAVIALGLVAIEFVANASGTALLGLIVVAAAGAALMLLRLLRTPRMGVSPWAVIGATGALALGLTQLPLLYDLTVGSVERKASSFSYLARSAANDRSWQIFLETSGLGVGLGSHRPSSLFFLVLSCLGLVGTVLLVVLIAAALRSAARTEPAAGWALLGVVVSGVIAVPDLSMPVIWVGIAVCVGSGFDTRLRRYSTDGSGAQLLQGPAAQVPALQRAETVK